MACPLLRLARYHNIGDASSRDQLADFTDPTQSVAGPRDTLPHPPWNTIFLFGLTKGSRLQVEDQIGSGLEKARNGIDEEQCHVVSVE